MDEFITILPANQEKQKRLRGIKTSRQESVTLPVTCLILKKWINL